MGLRISTNISSMSAGRNVAAATNDRQRVLEKLSSGNRIVRSGDDAAGLSISDKLQAGIRSMQMASRNTQDGISMMQTAEGGIVEAQNMLVRLRELSVQAASDTIGDVERSYTNKEFQLLKDEIQHISQNTTFDRKPLLNGMGNNVEFQIGIDNNAGLDRVSFSSTFANITPASLGIAGAHVSTKDSARQNLAAIDTAISKLGEGRAYVGGIQAQLGTHMANLSTHKNNLATGNSRLRDADYAEWTAKNVQATLIQDSANSVLAQSNDINKSAIRLLEKA